MDLMAGLLRMLTMNEILLATLLPFVGANIRLFQKSKKPERKPLGEIAVENGVFNLRLSKDVRERFYKKSKAIYYRAVAKHCLVRLSPSFFYMLCFIFSMHDLKLGPIMLAPIMLVLSVLSFMVIVIYEKWM